MAPDHSVTAVDSPHYMLLSCKVTGAYIMLLSVLNS